ncbi:hypothetical protein [Amycolatopsis sp. Hca4]|uniref:YqeB family protein n=1 Tax=Amycolatopsis sp. Hca4 TaxID=2742131 RepID=UPI00159143B1|nr:hypothetical protein [Amycolatopsis sp. Hca4]QKV77194.1 hypothetical protein HUT10_28025 [Amycolatopsis sp. Hca4]
METTVDEPSWLRTGSWVGCPLLGGALGVGVWAIAEWVSGLPAFPFQGVFKVLTKLPQPWATLAAVAGGLVLGLVFAAVWAHERLVVTVSPTRVTLVRGDKTRRIEADLEAVYLDGKELVLRTTDGREIAREKTDLRNHELAPAFAEHGYPWHDEPPVER